MTLGKTIHQIHVGDEASFVKKITEHDVELFGEITEDKNPAHFDEEYAKTTMFKTRISHGMFVGSLFSKVFGMDLPGPGAIYLNQSLSFRKPVYFNDVITVKVIVKEMNTEKNRVHFDCLAFNQNGDVVIKGEAEMMPRKEV